MTRILLALLALLTGLAAQLGPAQARVGADTEIGAVAGHGVGHVRVARATGECAPIQRGRLKAEPCDPPPMFHAPRVATVLTGIDRARE